MEANLTLILALLAAGFASALILLHALVDVMRHRAVSDLAQDAQD